MLVKIPGMGEFLAGINALSEIISALLDCFLKHGNLCDVKVGRESHFFLGVKLEKVLFLGVKLRESCHYKWDGKAFLHQV